MDEDFHIYPPYEVFYIESLLTVTNSALNSIQMFLEIESEIQKGNHEYNLTLIDNLQNLINQAAALSKYFWPIRKGQMHQKRGVLLRNVLEITEDNPLKKREVRDSIEHFDERLDKFTTQIISGNINPLWIGKRPVENGVANHFFRAYFTDEQVFEVLGEKFHVPVICNEIIRIHNKLIKCNETGRFNRI